MYSVRPYVSNTFIDPEPIMYHLPSYHNGPDFEETKSGSNEKSFLEINERMESSFPHLTTEEEV